MQSDMRFLYINGHPSMMSKQRRLCRSPMVLRSMRYVMSASLVSLISTAISCMPMIIAGIGRRLAIWYERV